MSMVLPLGLLVFALLAIAYLTWRFSTVARLRHMLGRPFALLGRGCLSAADACNNAYDNTLRWSQTYVLVRLVYLTVALGVFLGDYSISRLRGAALLGMAVQPLAWLPLENFAGLLWLLVPALLGSAAIDLLEIIPVGWRLFALRERIPTLMRIALAVLTSLLFALSLLVSACFVLWGQLQLLQTPTTIDQDQLALYIVACFGFLLAVVSCIALYAVLVGLGALVTLLVGALYCALRLLHLAFALLGDTVAGLSDEYRPLYGQPAYTVVDATPRVRSLPPASPQEPSVSDTPLSEIESEELTLMNSINRNVTLLGYNTASRIVFSCQEYASNSGATGVLLAIGVIDPSNTSTTENMESLPGVKNHTPRLTTMQKAYADELLEPGMTRLANSQIEQVIEEYADKHAGVLFIAADVAALPFIATPLRTLHTRLPNQEMLLVCPLSRVDKQNTEQLQKALSLMSQLQDEGTVRATLVIDASGSPLAAKVDAGTIEKAAVQALFGLVIAGYSDENNPSLNEVLTQLGAQSPLMGLAFSAAQVVSGKTPVTWQVVKAVNPKVGDRGSGSMADILIQATACTKMVMTDKANTASPQAIDAQKPCFVLYHLPYARGDKRFAKTATSLRRFLHITYPHAQAIMLHGNGVPLPTLESKYRVGVSCLYPLVVPSSGRNETLALEGLPVGRAGEELPIVKQNGRRKHEAIEK